MDVTELYDTRQEAAKHGELARTWRGFVRALVQPAGSRYALTIRLSYEE